MYTLNVLYFACQIKKLLLLLLLNINIRNPSEKYIIVAFWNKNTTFNFPKTGLSLQFGKVNAYNNHNTITTNMYPLLTTRQTTNDSSDESDKLIIFK